MCQATVIILHTELKILFLVLLEVYRHFGPRIKRCFGCRHCVKNDSLNIRYSNGMEVLGKRLSGLTRPVGLSESVSYVWAVSHALSAMNIIGRETDECNCSEQRWNDVSGADRSVMFTTIIATSCVSLYWRTAKCLAPAITTVANLSLAASSHGRCCRCWRRRSSNQQL